MINGVSTVFTVNRLINCQLGKTSGTLVLNTINKKKTAKVYKAEAWTFVFRQTSSSLTKG